MPITVYMETLMRYRSSILFALIAVALTAPIFAQDDVTAETDVFAPFVSRLRVAVRDPQVRITWRDSVDLEGGRYRIYRYTSEINQNTIDAAREVAVVEPGVETYLDTPLEKGEYYYAVLAENEEGELYRIFVPFRNKTIRSVAVTNLETEEDLAATIYDIEARIQDNAVYVRFDASRNGRTLSMYRSTIPFSTITDLTDATLLDQFESSTRRFVDYPVPEVDYYYAVFDATLVERGTISIQPGENALAAPIRIVLGENADVTVDVPRLTKRPAPLPMLQFAGGISGAQSPAMSELPRGVRAQPVSSETRRAIDGLLARAPGRSEFAPSPEILPEDRSPDAEGAEATLAQILEHEFSEGNYEQTVSLLESLLEFPLNPALERRVRYYLGQALFFDGRRESAFLEFLSASEGDMYVRSRLWIDGILSSARP